ncbi:MULTISPECIES: cobalt-precorrin-5B (C(1))-methyltransferase CbiD [unclassified Dysgonomonas]|jgi:cobalt-precorrin-5B (C1)-methyltransferase|uniref:cobalt-precorrin-5B (C(1))-methyltransferase CbiD n=1 Tax=unclassified Dysgonomonas TaxID=2630389 RepID=UPI0025B8B54E|nr:MULTISPECIES: cobalt-precorrin-5B (C(1))-methyltransferase CbiD [unclassified Dysgonomonas]MDR2001832.1 cobalt-precorrin-5B (C(1))-methyltransferase CbiD [Prevotella sp.]HMM04220.1 cobalt-precorrin-5B (C(1))-methyltransferase CbiD [Dysgonomonas sp.]
MILIFGGTTEGRKALSVCDGAAKPYYYSTKGDLQKVESVYAILLSGGLDEESMITCCKENNIKLIIDAAHPFAGNLHGNIASASAKLEIPVVRYERSYPEHTDDLLWFDSYNDAIHYLESNKIDNLLALTGVNTIAKLKPYWKRHNCWFRILDREESRTIAQANNFPYDKILYYRQGEDETPLFERIKPQAIITKESGDSGGFNEKADAARKLNIPFLVVKRPPLSPSFISVYGENGLRKEIEKYAPGFFDLRTGYTTGTCATAAAKAALTTLLTNEIQEEIGLTLPNGEWIRIPIATTRFSENTVSCSVIKDSGDDPDITNGCEIVSTVQLCDTHKGVRFLQGKGVGTVTLPGLDIEIGEPAINKTPRMMIKREIFKVLRHNQDKLPDGDSKTGVDVTISVTNGEEIALKTFNPKLGITGGISIIGTSGIVKPFSSEAFINSIRREMQVAKALGCERVVINSGAKSERFVKQRYPNLPAQAFIHYGNFIGETIKIASDLGFKSLTLGIMLGKAVKLAEGSLDTHSKKTVMNKEFLTGLAYESNCSERTIAAIQEMTLARQLWDIITTQEEVFFTLLIKRCYDTCVPLLPNGKLTIMLIDEDGNIIL